MWGREGSIEIDWRKEGREKKFIPKRRIIPAFEFLSVFALEEGGGEGAVR